MRTKEEEKGKGGKGIMEEEVGGEMGRRREKGERKKRGNEVREGGRGGRREKCIINSVQ